MMPYPGFPYQPANPLGFPPYASPVNPNLQSFQSPLGPPRTPTGGKAYMPAEYRRPSHVWVEAHAPPHAMPVPDNEPQTTTELVLYNERRPAVVAMGFLSEWIGDHITDYSTSGRVRDIAERARHNMGDFETSFDSYRATRATARREQGGHRLPHHMEDLYHRARDVKELYESTMARYDGPFKRKKDCSDTEKEQAQKILEHMFGRDYDTWDGFIWHVMEWMSTFHNVFGVWYRLSNNSNSIDS
ncbi:hypothetical protein CHU98_g2768 [Xylaria longipes]|nr:hypothetical protein CHU98_g2768 [Xylaria longipes]